MRARRPKTYLFFFVAVVYGIDVVKEPIEQTTAKESRLSMFIRRRRCQSRCRLELPLRKLDLLLVAVEDLQTAVGRLQSSD